MCEEEADQEKERPACMRRARGRNAAPSAGASPARWRYVQVGRRTGFGRRVRRRSRDAPACVADGRGQAFPLSDVPQASLLVERAELRNPVLTAAAAAFVAPIPARFYTRTGFADLANATRCLTDPRRAPGLLKLANFGAQTGALLFTQ